MKIAFGGDAMLGRFVAGAMRELGDNYPLEAIAPLFRAADLGVVNLECAVTSNLVRWSGGTKAFYFRAEPAAAMALARAGVDVVNLANNHALDFGDEGLVESLELLSRAGVVSFGAGRTLAEALSPALVRVGELVVGLVGFTDHPIEFAATACEPGVAFLAIENQPLSALRIATEGVRQCRSRGADLVVVSMHWGPNYDGEPEPEIVSLAHALIDAGADVVFGHSPHVFHGIEVYRQRPILYAMGDLVDDYYVGDQGNDRGIVATVTFDGVRARGIDVSPCLIAECRVVPAPAAIAREINERLTRLSAKMGTAVRTDERGAHIECATSAHGSARARPRGGARGRGASRGRAARRRPARGGHRS